MLSLRRWTDDDLEPLIDMYRDPVLRRWTRLPVETPEDARRWLDLQRHGWETGDRLSFAVIEDDLLVGNVALKRNDPARRSAEVGYWTAAAARGRGVAPRAVEALTAWAVTTYAGDGLELLELLYQVDNPASCRVAEKAGFAFDRVLPARAPYPRDGHRHVRLLSYP